MQDIFLENENCNEVKKWLCIAISDKFDELFVKSISIKFLIKDITKKILFGSKNSKKLR